MSLSMQQVLITSGYENYTDIKRLKFIIESLQQHIPPGGSVLDVGCGNGIISYSVGKTGFDVFGIDISEKAIDKARSKNDLPNVHFAVMSAEEFAIGAAYDAVICSEVLEHLSAPSDLLKVISHSLKKTGILIVTVPNGKGPREVLITKPIIALQRKGNWLWHLVQKLKKGLGYKGTTLQSDADDLTHLQFFTKKSLNHLANENNFSIIKFCKTNFVENVFPFSLLTKKIKILQKFDCAVADILPYNFTCGFASVWQKK